MAWYLIKQWICLHSYLECESEVRHLPVSLVKATSHKPQLFGGTFDTYLAGQDTSCI
jgi:hypothetical protein